MSFGLGHGRELSIEGVGYRQEDLPPFDPRDRAASQVDPRAWFAQPDRPFELEIGSGKGTFLLQQAVLQPEVNFLGIEWAGEFFRYAADRVRRREIANVKMLHTDATEFVRYRVPDGICRVVHLYFSDPWPKARHHKRRVVQDQTLHDFHRVLEPAGVLHLVTDHEDLWAWYEAHAARHEDIFTRETFAPPESAGDGEVVGTNFERKYAREGRPFRAMSLRRRG
ncbi:MAG: tRNA (guanosine(46)-N7)-methyltransferase TrmB [Phycisphaerales bacterium]|nr:tRNA (guanosine(46)-N7)-methyltransferase TrmB [Phycisphaerales bacterium]